MLHDVSRFSGSAVSKGIKKKLISQPSVNVHTCFFATGITGLFSGLAVSKVEKNKQNKTNQKKKKREYREYSWGVSFEEREAFCQSLQIC